MFITNSPTVAEAAKLDTNVYSPRSSNPKKILRIKRSVKLTNKNETPKIKKLVPSFKYAILKQEHCFDNILAFLSVKNNIKTANKVINIPASKSIYAESNGDFLMSARVKDEITYTPGNKGFFRNNASE